MLSELSSREAHFIEFLCHLDKTPKENTIVTLIQLVQFISKIDMNSQKLPTLHLDFRSGLPIYIQIMNQIEQQVIGGKLKPGDQLPTVRALASDLRVNFNTVARAYHLLDEARIISTQQGRGTYITEIPPPEVTEKLRRETLEALARRYIKESMRLGFSKSEITQLVKDQLKVWNESQELDND